MNKERLMRLVKLLESTARADNNIEFNLTEWGKNHSCGTQACAIGLAALSGIFKDEGFSYTGGWMSTIGPIFNNKDDITSPIYYGWEAVQQFFGISLTQAYSLFDAAYYDIVEGPKARLAVAKRIRKFIEDQS